MHQKHFWPHLVTFHVQIYKLGQEVDQLDKTSGRATK